MALVVFFPSYLSKLLYCTILLKNLISRPTVFFSVSYFRAVSKFGYSHCRVQFKLKKKKKKKKKNLLNI